VIGRPARGLGGAAGGPPGGFLATNVPLFGRFSFEIGFDLAGGRVLTNTSLLSVRVLAPVWLRFRQIPRRLPAFGFGGGTSEA